MVDNEQAEVKQHKYNQLIAYILPNTLYSSNVVQKQMHSGYYNVKTISTNSAISTHIWAYVNQTEDIYRKHSCRTEIAPVFI